MSLGFIGYARLLVEDEEYALYQYSGENWNDEKSANGDRFLYDGEFQIKKSALVEPEIHERIKKMPSGRKKLVTKKIIRFVDIAGLILRGDIVILKKCKNEFLRHKNHVTPHIAHILLIHIFEEYQELGKLPEKVGFIQ